MALIKLNNNSISAVSALPSGIDTGKVGQVVTAVYDTDSESTSSSSFVQIGPSLSITPSAASSKIFVQVHGGSVYTASDKNGKFSIFRDSTNLGNTNGFYVHFANLSYLMSGLSMSVLDSPSSTSAITYATYVKTSSAPVLFQNNTTRTVITAMEILA